MLVPHAGRDNRPGVHRIEPARRGRAGKHLPASRAEGYRSSLNMLRLLLATALFALARRGAARRCTPGRTRTACSTWRTCRRAPRARLRRASSCPGSRRSKADRWWEKVATRRPTRSTAPPRSTTCPAELVRAVIWAESAGDAGAVSHRGAIGLMQLMPHTAGEMYVEDPVDPGAEHHGRHALPALARQPVQGRHDRSRSPPTTPAPRRCASTAASRPSKRRAAT